MSNLFVRGTTLTKVLYALFGLIKNRARIGKICLASVDFHPPLKPPAACSGRQTAHSQAIPTTRLTTKTLIRANKPKTGLNGRFLVATVKYVILNLYRIKQIT